MSEHADETRPKETGAGRQTGADDARGRLKLLFDFDGTLHKTDEIYVPAFREGLAWLREQGQDVPEAPADAREIGYWLGYSTVEMWNNFAPELPKEWQKKAAGVVGAGIATSLSRFVEFIIVVSGAHRSTERYPFMQGVFRNFRIDGNLARQVAIKGSPLLLNECLWSMSQAMLLQCYSVRGIQAVAAMNITSTITQIFNEVFLSLGNATAILVGQELGASRMTGARRTAWRMITLSVSSCAIMGTLLALFSPLIPHIYNTEPAIRELASSVIRMAALCMPLFAFANAAYFTLRSGGKTLITFFFDSCYTWLVNFPIAFVLSRYTALPLPTVYLFVNGVDLLKCIIGFILVKKGVWVNNIVASDTDAPQAD